MISIICFAQIILEVSFFLFFLIKGKSILMPSIMYQTNFITRSNIIQQFIFKQLNIYLFASHYKTI